VAFLEAFALLVLLSLGTRVEVAGAKRGVVNETVEDGVDVVGGGSRELVAKELLSFPFATLTREVN
jgi:hypothetical protein